MLTGKKAPSCPGLPEDSWEHSVSVVCDLGNRVWEVSGAGWGEGTERRHGMLAAEVGELSHCREFVRSTKFRTEAESFGWSFVFEDLVSQELKKKTTRRVKVREPSGPAEGAGGMWALGGESRILKWGEREAGQDLVGHNAESGLRAGSGRQPEKPNPGRDRHMSQEVGSELILARERHGPRTGYSEAASKLQKGELPLPQHQRPACIPVLPLGHLLLLSCRIFSGGFLWRGHFGGR